MARFGIALALAMGAASLGIVNGEGLFQTKPPAAGDAAARCLNQTEMLVDGACVVAVQRVVFQSSLIHEWISLDGETFVAQDTFKVMVHVREVAVGANGTQAARAVANSAVWIANGGPVEAANETVYVHDAEKQRMAEVQLSSAPDATPLQLRTNALGQASLSIPAEHRLAGVAPLRIRAEFMPEDAWLVVRPEVALWSKLAALNGTAPAGLELSDKAVQRLSSDSSELLSLLGGEVGLGGHRLARRARVSPGEHGAFQLLGLEQAHDAETDIIFAPLHRVRRLVRRGDTSANITSNDNGNIASQVSPRRSASSAIAAAVRSCVDALVAFGQTIKNAAKALFAWLRVLIPWPEIAVTSQVLTRHIEGVLGDLAFVTNSSRDPVLKSINLTRALNVEKLGKAAANSLNPSHGGHGDQRTSEMDEALSPAAPPPVRETYVNELVATYWSSGGAARALAEAERKQLEAIRKQLDTTMVRTVLDPATRENVTLKEAQQKLSRELDAALSQRRVGGVLSRLMPSVGRYAQSAFLKGAAAIYDLGMRVLRMTVAAGLAVTIDALNMLRTLLTTPLPEFFLSMFYRKVVMRNVPGAELTLLSLLALVGSAPFTTLSMWLHGKAPFSHEILARQEELPPGDFLNLVSHEPTAIRRMGGFQQIQLYFGFMKIALATIDSVFMALPLPPSMGNVYWLLMDLLNTPLIPMSIPGPAHHLSQSIYTIFTVSLISDLYFLYKRQIGRFLLDGPASWVSPMALANPAHAEAIEWARDTVWFTARGCVSIGIFVWLYNNAFHTIRANVPNPATREILIESTGYDMTATTLGMIGMILRPPPPPGIYGARYLGVFPGALFGPVQNALRLSANALRIRAGLLQMRGAFLPIDVSVPGPIDVSVPGPVALPNGTVVQDHTLDHVATAPGPSGVPQRV